MAPTRLLRLLSSFLAFEPSRRRPRPAARLRQSPRLRIEALEARSLLTANYVGDTPIAPLVNRAGVGLGNFLGGVPLEPMLAINPTDPANVVIASQDVMRVTTAAGYGFSNPSVYPLPAGALSRSGDPDLAFDNQGRLFWSQLAWYPGDERDVTITPINPTTGTATGAAARVPNAPFSKDDKPLITVDTDLWGGSWYGGNIYAVWSRYANAVGEFEVYFSRSTDNGVTWSAPLKLSDFNGPDNIPYNADDEGFVWPADVSVDSRGGVYVAYHSQPDVNENGGGWGNPGGTKGQVIALYSGDGGQNFVRRPVAFQPGQADVTFNRQDAPNGGTIPGTQFWTIGSSQPWVLADPSRHSHVYVITTDDPDNVHGSGDDADIVLARSTDGGFTWARSTIVRGPTDLADTHQLFPTAAIDKFGNIVVAWYDTRRRLFNQDLHWLLDVYATYSTDGGLTWAPEFMVSDPNFPFDPDVGAINRFDGPPKTTRIGEYFGIALFGGTAYVAHNGSTYSGNTPVGQQVYFDSFPLDGSLFVSGSQPDNSFALRGVPPYGTPDFLDILVNGQREYTGLRAGVESENLGAGVTFQGNAGNDTLTLDFSSPLMSTNILPRGVGTYFDGAGGTDRLVTVQPSSTSATYALDLGRLLVDGVSLVRHNGVEAVDLTGAAGTNVFTLSSFPGTATLTAPSGNGLDALNLTMTGGTVVLNSWLSLTSDVVTLPFWGNANLNGSTNGMLDLNGPRTFNIADGTAAWDLIVNLPLASAGAGPLFKTGAGTLVLNGVSTFTGTTTVDQGTLGGVGTLAGPVSVHAGATLAPGMSVGRLSTGSVTLATGSTLAAQLDGTAAGLTYDQLNVKGTVDLGGATLSVTRNFAPANGAQFVIINNDGTDRVVGTFNGLKNKATLTIGGMSFQILYNGGDGNDVVLVAKAGRKGSGGGLAPSLLPNATSRLLLVDRPDVEVLSGGSKQDAALLFRAPSQGNPLQTRYPRVQPDDTETLDRRLRDLPARSRSGRSVTFERPSRTGVGAQEGPTLLEEWLLTGEGSPPPNSESADGPAPP